MYDTPQHYEPDTSRQDATGRDLSDPVATADDFISVKEALAVFLSRGRSVTERTLQRYCEKRYLDGQKRITAEGEKWFVTKSSVERRIKELDDFDALRASRRDATSRDTSGPVAEVNEEVLEHDSARQPAHDDVSDPVVPAQPSHTTADDLSRQDATGRDRSSVNETSEHEKRVALSEAERQLYERLYAQYEDRIEELAKDKEALTQDKASLMRQLEAKDRQIDRFFESERDTKTLAGRFQSLMSALWSKKGGEGGDRYVPVHEALESGLEREGDGGRG